MKLLDDFLRAFGLVTLTRHRSACERAKGVCDSFEGMANVAEREVLRLQAEFTDAERDLIRTLRERREVRTREWSHAECAEVARVLKSGPGELLRAELHAWAHERLKHAVKAAPGSEPRALGFAHGATTAAEVLDSLSEFTAPEPAESGSTDAHA